MTTPELPHDSMISPAFLDASEENGRLVFARDISGPVTMLNLLRFRPHANYDAHPELAPTESISGRAAYQLYLDHTLPYLKAAGGAVEFLAEGGHYLIGPVEARWDLVLLVKHQSLATLISMAEDDGYMSGIGHRLAALEDSRLLPLVRAHLPDDR